MEEILETIQSQYSASSRLVKLIEGINEIIDPKNDIELLYNELFNINTARGTSLDIWGKIVDSPRSIDVESEKFFGFNGQELEGFNVHNFYVYGLTERYEFSDEAYRELILLKSILNISSCDVESINKIFSVLFKDKKAYVLEVGLMQVRFVFEYQLDEYEKAIFKDLNILPNSAGVGYEYYEINTLESFGFNGSGLIGFDNGVFSSNGIINISN